MALLVDQVSLLNFGGSGNYSRDRYEDNDVSISSSNSWNQPRGGQSHGSDHGKGKGKSKGRGCKRY